MAGLGEQSGDLNRSDREQDRSPHGVLHQLVAHGVTWGGTSSASNDRVESRAERREVVSVGYKRQESERFDLWVGGVAVRGTVENPGLTNRASDRECSPC